MSSSVQDNSVLINREAGDKTKGFRFQKLRAVIRFLERIEAYQDGQVMCALEFLEDSLLIDPSDTSFLSAEENKFYTSTLTFNSAALKNTIVAFLDLKLVFQTGDLKLGVYASANVGQERINSATREALGLETGSASYEILKKLVANDPLSDEEVFVAYSLIREEYKSQYSGTSKGFMALFDKWDMQTFREFLVSIDWSISTEDNDDLENEAITEIKRCRFYNHRHEGLEDYILCRLLDELEKRSGKKHSTDRLIGTDGLKLIFTEIVVNAGGDERPIDPAADQWENVQLDDFRNLSDKILAVCPEFSQRLLEKLARSCSLARAIHPSEEREHKAFRRRILDSCENSLETLELNSKMTEQQVTKLIDQLAEESLGHIDTYRKSYKYQDVNKLKIKGAVLSLFDDCFLAFDEERSGFDK